MHASRSWLARSAVTRGCSHGSLMVTRADPRDRAPEVTPPTGLLQQRSGHPPGRGLLGLLLWARTDGDEELGIRVPPELVAQDPERARRVTEVASDIVGLAGVDEVR